MGFRVLLLAFLVSLLAVSPAASTALSSPVSGETPRLPDVNPPDPSTDVIGWENGYWYDETIDVDQRDGLSKRELEAYVGRAMARVERLRGLEFKRSVPVTTITRAQFRRMSSSRGQTSQAFSDWNNQVWEALFIVDEGHNVTTQLHSVSASAVLGFYAPSSDRIVIVVPSKSQAVIDNATLAHELTHALQDQHFDLGAPRFRPQTQDAQLGQNGLIEGDAMYVERMYVSRCGVKWECVPTPPSETAGNQPAPSQFNRGIYVTLIQPYSDGLVYIHSLRGRDGWRAVNERYRDPPNATEPIIHPDRPADEPTTMSYEHAASNGWEPYPAQGVNGYDTLGETSIYTMFWYQDRRYGIPVVNWRDLLRSNDSEIQSYNYTSRPSAGWANDRIYPYHKDDQFGYVWKTTWDTNRDAREFARAYRRVLRGHGARKVGPTTWVIRSGGFADAFRVVRVGDTVTIVNGPTVDALSDIKPGIRVDRRLNGTVPTARPAALDAPPA